eukprot:TRINITY_DN29832_c0_g1_i2.p1 TRINITY_DN29832_c0_g1~~TRINITY_DN29832_c0_g1_i2.p1  ORF type:complete len:126 (-),score=26.82 TRINITY_DN29832_c0_g1_i2:211-588(-)
MSTMLFKVLIFLKRRPGMPTEAFRDYYENVHSKIGERYASRGLKRYLRRYVQALDESLTDQAQGLDFDVITELWFDDRKAYEQVARYAARGLLPPDVIEDEERVFDRPKNRYITVIEHESALPAV